MEAGESAGTNANGRVREVNVAVWTTLDPIQNKQNGYDGWR